MAFLDEIGRTLADKGREAAQKAKEMAEVLQLKGQISAENSKIKELYGAIGAVYFKKYREEPDDEFQLFFPEIEKSLARIAELEAKVKELEGTQFCASCGAALRKDDVFCSKCGTLVVQEEPGKETDKEDTDFGEEEDESDTVVSALEDSGEGALQAEGESAEEEDIFVDEES